ncbi:MAG: hypothetical protein AAF596_00490 [Planctomycetota bacterium]
MSEATTLSPAAGDDLDGAEAAGPVCSECGGRLPTEQTPVCPHCGWYASLGIHVDVSREFEQAATGDDQPAAPPSHLEVWSKLIPVWGWVLIGTAVGTALVSLAVRLMYPEAGGVRTTWAVVQLIGGLAIAAVCHLASFILVSTSDPDMGNADIVVNPFKAWKKLLGALPKRLAIVNSANASVCAAVCAAGIIGGIPYERLLDWGITAPVEKSLLGAVMERASGAGGPEMSMEEAVTNFAGDAGGPRNLDGLPDPSKQNQTPTIVRKTIDAVVLGYEVDAAGKVTTLLLATERKSKLVYSGRVTPQLEDEEMAKLAAKLRAYRAPRPIINVPVQATWVQPRLTCRVSYERRVESGQLTSLLWEELLSEMKLPW